MPLLRPKTCSLRFGGHGAAVGVTLPVANLEEFTKRLCDYMDQLPEDAFHPLIEIDSMVSLDELTIENVELMEKLAPFGQENRVPCLLARDVTMANCRAVGAEKNHFSCALSDGTNRVSGIMFHCNDIDELMKTCNVVNAAFEVQIDEWRGRRTVKAMLKSLSPAGMCGALAATLDPGNTRFVTSLFAASDESLCEDCIESSSAIEAYEADRASNREKWQRRAQSNPAKLESDIIGALIGDGSLHDSQREVLDLLGEGKSVMAVMATGRGKSLTFHVHAAMTALRDGKASLFVYPLRALITDQSFHLNDALSRFGLQIDVLTGESTPKERERIYRAIADGSTDMVLTTPSSWNTTLTSLPWAIGSVSSWLTRRTTSRSTVTAAARLTAPSASPSSVWAVPRCWLLPQPLTETWRVTSRPFCPSRRACSIEPPEPTWWLTTGAACAPARTTWRNWWPPARRPSCTSARASARSPLRASSARRLVSLRR